MDFKSKNNKFDRVLLKLLQKLNEVEKGSKKYKKEEERIKEMSQKLQTVSFQTSTSKS